MQTIDQIRRSAPVDSDAAKNPEPLTKSIYDKSTPYMFRDGNIYKLLEGGEYKPVEVREVVGSIQKSRNSLLDPYNNETFTGAKELLQNAREVLSAYTNYHIAPALGISKDLGEPELWQKVAAAQGYNP